MRSAFVALVLLVACVGDSPTTTPSDAGGSTDATSNPDTSNPLDASATDTGTPDGGDASVEPPATGTFKFLSHFATSADTPPFQGWVAAGAPDGGYVVAAGYKQTFTFKTSQPLIGAGTDFFVGKLDASGAPLWNVGFGGPGTDQPMSIAVDANGDVYVAGISDGASIAIGATLTKTSTFNQGFVAKLAGANGAVQWAVNYNATATSGYGSMAVCAHGARVGVAGSMSGNGAKAVYKDKNGTYVQSAAPPVGVGSAAFASELDATNGNGQWINFLESTGGTVEPSEDYAFGVGLDASFGLYVAGYFTGTPLRDLTQSSLATQMGTKRNAFVAKLAPGDGKATWVKAYGDTGNTNTQPALLLDDGAGKLVVGGVFEGAVDFGKGAQVASANGDAWVVQLDETTGATTWAKTFGVAGGADRPRAMASDAWGNVVIALDNTAGSGASVDGKALPTAAGAYAIKLGPTGTARWVRSTTAVRAGGVAIVPSGSMAVFGTFSGAVDFGGGSVSATSNFDLYELGLSP